MMRTIYCFFIFIILTDSVFSHDDEVTVFDVGQGNCVLIKHNNEAMLIDAGSKEWSFSGLYSRLFGVAVQQRYRIVESSESASGSSASDFGTSDSATSASCNTEEDTISEEEVDTEKPPKNDQWIKQKIIENIRKKIPENNNTLYLKTVVISHPDEDHYNLLHEIFDNNIDFKIKTIVLGGRWKQYGQDIQEWLKDHYFNNNATKKITDVIFTGAQNGTASPDEKYARAYGSVFHQNTRSTTEKKIEKALQFKGPPGFIPSIKILAMNVGYKEPLDTETEEKKKDAAANTSSIVLRVEGKASFTITGDADGCTWDFIEGSYQGNTAPLQTDYFLLSHHGALRHGPSRESILKVLKPKVCLISTGRVGKPYFHPRGEIIDRLVTLGTLEKFNSAYPLSYYRAAGAGDPVRKRKYYYEMIFSTLDSGNIRFKLLPPSSDNLFITRNRKKFLIPSDQDIIFKSAKNPQLKKYNNNLSAVYRSINTEEQAKSKQPRYFIKPSSKYNLILPLENNFKIKKDDAYYLNDLVSHEVYKIEIKK